MTLRKLKYKPSTHAVERFREYFAVKEFNAVDFANDLMKSAKFVMSQADGRRLYKNEEYDTMVVLAPSDNTIVTVLPSQEKRKEITQPNAIVTKQPKVTIASATNVIIEKAIETIKREIAKVKREFTTDIRKLKIEQAEIGVEIAQAQVNKAKCRAPHTQELIQQRIAAMETYYNTVSAKITKLTEEYEKTTAEASEFLTTEVTA